MKNEFEEYVRKGRGDIDGRLSQKKSIEKRLEILKNHLKKYSKQA